jgi:hypothetical protein
MGLQNAAKLLHTTLQRSDIRLTRSYLKLSAGLRLITFFGLSLAHRAFLVPFAMKDAVTVVGLLEREPLRKCAS